MKRILGFVLALFVGITAAAQTTPNLGLNTPLPNAVNWNIALNQNFTLLDAFLSGTNLNTNLAFQYKALFSNGTPSNTTCVVNGTMDYDYSVTPYASYVCNGASVGISGLWKGFGPSSFGNINVSNIGNINYLHTGTIPWADTSFYGGVNDGVTDNAPAIIAALQSPACSSTTSPYNNQNSCTIYMPCGGSGCYISHLNNLLTYITLGGSGPGAGNWVGWTAPTLLINGGVQLGSTLDIGGTYLKGNAPGEGGYISAPQAFGSMGTAVTSVNTPVTFTPTCDTADGSNACNFYPGDAISVAHVITCTASLTRTTLSTITGAVNNVTATASAGCRIPPTRAITVTGCSNSSLNINLTPLGNSDYPSNTLWWTQVGTAATATGCTITGADDTEDTAEIATVTGTAPTQTLTATFNFQHSATDPWGYVAVKSGSNVNGGDGPAYGISDITIDSNYGAAIYLADSCCGTTNLDNVNIGTGWLNNYNFVPEAIAIDDLDAYGFADNVKIDKNSLLNTAMGDDYGCWTNCEETGYPWALHLGRIPSSLITGGGATSIAQITVKDTNITGGIKIDTSGESGIGGGTTTLESFEDDIIIHNVIFSAITLDTRQMCGGVGINLFADGVWPENQIGYGSSDYMIAATDNTQAGCIYAELAPKLTNYPNPFANSYYYGTLRAKRFGNTFLTNNIQMKPAIDNSLIYDHELRGIGYTMGPQLIPGSTLAVTAPASLAPPTNCTSTAITGPDGLSTSGAIELVGTVNNTNCITGAGSWSMGTNTGDHFLVSTWVKPGTGAEGAAGTVYWGYGQTIRLSSAGTDTWINSGSGSYDMNLAKDTWHPVVSEITVTSGQTAAHTINLQLGSGPNLPDLTPSGTDFFDWCVVYIPASANAPEALVEEWRQYLLHGYCPSGVTGPALAYDPALPIYAGSTLVTPTGTGFNPNLNSGSGSVTLSSTQSYYICTASCTLTVPVPVAGHQVCVRNSTNTSGVITLAALGSSAAYENTAHTATGTAGTGTATSAGAVGDSICLVGETATKYDVMSFSGTWTMN